MDTRPQIGIVQAIAANLTWKNPSYNEYMNTNSGVMFPHCLRSYKSATLNIDVFYIPSMSEGSE
jgi:hypothetical protein